MALPQSLFINTFQEGSQENANIGIGNLVGVETYSVKGVARLTKDTTNVGLGVVTDLPLYCVTGATSDVLFVQGDTGKVYMSTNNGATWTDVSNADSSGLGQGLIYFEGYVFAFRAGTIDYLSSPYTSADWTTAWQPNGVAPVLFVNTPIPTIIFPNDGFAYFGTGSRMGKLGWGTAPTFNPAGTGGTDYFYSDNYVPSIQGSLLPTFYQITALSFLPNNYIAIGTSSYQNASVADVILWNPTLSTYETPLRLYSQAEEGTGSTPNVESGIKQLINRNNVLYATVGGSQSIFQTNGTTFNLIVDLSLHSNLRKSTGEQAQSPIFLNPRLGAIDIFGNKLLTGMSTPNDISYYPASYGLFPCGVWSVAFTEEGFGAASTAGKAIQLEYVLSTNTTIATNPFTIGMIKCLTSNQSIIGWQDNASFGIDLVSTTEFQTSASDSIIESQMMEIGTPLEPAVITTVQVNTVRSLLNGQTVTLYYRSAFDQPFTPVPAGTFTINTGNIQNNNSLKCVITDLGTVKYLQLQVQMSTGGGNEIWSPEIRNIIIN